MRQYGWTPRTIAELQLNSKDYIGLWFWYNDAKEQSKEIDDKVDAIKNKNK